MTTYDLERCFAIDQVKHYAHINQNSALTGDKSEYRRTVDSIDLISIEYAIRSDEVFIA